MSISRFLFGRMVMAAARRAAGFAAVPGRIVLSHQSVRGESRACACAACTIAWSVVAGGGATPHARRKSA